MNPIKLFRFHSTLSFRSVLYNEIKRFCILSHLTANYMLFCIEYCHSMSLNVFTLLNRVQYKITASLDFDFCQLYQAYDICSVTLLCLYEWLRIFFISFRFIYFIVLFSCGMKIGLFHWHKVKFLKKLKILCSKPQNDGAEKMMSIGAFKKMYVVVYLIFYCFIELRLLQKI